MALGRYNARRIMTRMCGLQVKGEAKDVTSEDDRARAVQHLEELLKVLKNSENATEITPLAEECESLITAVKAFHMEAIRFRMYNLRRQLTGDEQLVPSEATELFSNAQEALEAAGFQTK
ncbi:hypothetical protein EVA25_00210 [bacterium]|nr:MAG: hypothetical protein EVA25_00210 [bacterium]